MQFLCVCIQNNRSIQNELVQRLALLTWVRLGSHKHTGDKRTERPSGRFSGVAERWARAERRDCLPGRLCTVEMLGIVTILAGFSGWKCECKQLNSGETSAAAAAREKHGQFVGRWASDGERQTGEESDTKIISLCLTVTGARGDGQRSFCRNWNWNFANKLPFKGLQILVHKRRRKYDGVNL